MTVRLLVVDNEPDVEPLFRQQFRREVRDGIYTLDFALSALAGLAILDDPIGAKTVGHERPTVTTALARGADKWFNKPVDFPKLKKEIIAVKAEAIGGNG